MPVDDEYLDVTDFVNEHRHCKGCFKTFYNYKKLYKHKRYCNLPVLKDICIEFTRTNCKQPHFKIYAKTYSNNFSYKIVSTDDDRFTR